MSLTTQPNFEPSLYPSSLKESPMRSKANGELKIQSKIKMGTRKSLQFAKIYVVFGLVVNFICHVTSLSITVSEMECVSEDVYQGDTISGNFVVIDSDVFWSSDHPGMEFTVTSSEGNLVYSLKGSSEDKYEFKAPRSGMYKFCFRNPTSSPETVSFYIHVSHIPNEHDLAKDEHLDPISTKIMELREALESVTAEQKYMKACDGRHRNTNESTRKRVISFTLGEYVLFAGANALQVVYIRRLFGNSVGFNRV